MLVFACSLPHFCLQRARLSGLHLWRSRAQVPTLPLPILSFRAMSRAFVWLDLFYHIHSPARGAFKVSLLIYSSICPLWSMLITTIGPLGKKGKRFMSKILTCVDSSQMFFLAAKKYCKKGNVKREPQGRTFPIHS